MSTQPGRAGGSADVPLPISVDAVEEPLAVAMLQHLLGIREYGAARDLMDRWGPRFESSQEYLRARRGVLGKLGEMTESLLASHRLVELGAARPDSVLALEGRIAELHGPGPHLPGPVNPVEPASSRRVVHLVKESRPYLSNGFTTRSHYNFVAEKEAGLQPVVVTEPGFPRSLVGEDARKEMLLDGVGHYHLDLGTDVTGNLPADRFLQLFADMAYERVTRIRPALIHVSSGRRGYETCLVALAVKEKTGIPVVYEIRSFFAANWTDDVRYEAQGEIYEGRMKRELECMDRADLVLTIGEAMKSELVRLGVPETKIGVVPNGVDVERFAPRPRDTDLAWRLGIGDVPTFGYVSNMDHYRESQETLVRAAAHLARAGRPEHCVLVGDGPRRERLETLAAELGVQDRVHFTGRVEHDDVGSYYSLIDVFVVPRTRERAATYVTPLKPFEAMAMGIPVVVSDLPALREIAPAPERGWVFAPDAPMELKDVLVSVFDDPEERQRRASSALAWVRAERQWAHNGPRYRQYFEDVLRRGGR